MSTNISKETAIDLVLDTPVAVEYAGEPLYYKFVPDVDGPYSFSSSGNCDTYGKLLDADGNDLKVDDDSGSANNFRIKYNLTAGIVYYLIARLYTSSNSGEFEISVICTPAANTNTSKETAIDLSLDTLVLLSGDEWEDHWYRFVPPRDGRYRMQTNGNESTQGWLYDADGNTLAFDYGYAHETYDEVTGWDMNFRMICELTGGTVYYLQIPATSYPYEFSLEVTRLPNITFSLVSPPTKTRYPFVETNQETTYSDPFEFDLTGLRVQGVDEDGYTQIYDESHFTPRRMVSSDGQYEWDGSIINYGWGAFPFREYEYEDVGKMAGTHTIWLAQNGDVDNEINVSFEITIVTATTVEIVRQPTKTQYKPGESLDLRGMAYRFIYNDGVADDVYEFGQGEPSYDDYGNISHNDYYITTDGVISFNNINPVLGEATLDTANLCHDGFYYPGYVDNWWYVYQWDYYDEQGNVQNPLPLEPGEYTIYIYPYFAGMLRASNLFLTGGAVPITIASVEIKGVDIGIKTEYELGETLNTDVSVTVYIPSSTDENDWISVDVSDTAVFEFPLTSTWVPGEYTAPVSYVYSGTTYTEDITITVHEPTKTYTLSQLMGRLDETLLKTVDYSTIFDFLNCAQNTDKVLVPTITQHNNVGAAFTRVDARKLQLLSPDGTQTGYVYFNSGLSWSGYPYVPVDTTRFACLSGRLSDGRRFLYVLVKGMITGDKSGDYVSNLAFAYNVIFFDDHSLAVKLVSGEYVYTDMSNFKDIAYYPDLSVHLGTDTNATVPYNTWGYFSANDPDGNSWSADTAKLVISQGKTDFSCNEPIDVAVQLQLPDGSVQPVSYELSGLPSVTKHPPVLYRPGTHSVTVTEPQTGVSETFTLVITNTLRCELHSARIMYRGDTHRDIYFNGFSHRQLWKDGELLWEKKYYVTKPNPLIVRGLAFYAKLGFTVSSYHGGGTINEFGVSFISPGSPVIIPDKLGICQISGYAGPAFSAKSGAPVDISDARVIFVGFKCAGYSADEVFNHTGLVPYTAYNGDVVNCVYAGTDTELYPELTTCNGLTTGFNFYPVDNVENIYSPLLPIYMDFSCSTSDITKITVKTENMPSFSTKGELLTYLTS